MVVSVTLALSVLSGIGIDGTQAQGFLFSSALIVASTLLSAVAARRQITEVRKAVGVANAEKDRCLGALARAGVCLVVLDRYMVWVEANETAWTAFGFDPKIARAAHAAFALDDDSAAALMHPSSRQQWQGLVERVKSQMEHQGSEHHGDPPGLGSYDVSLYGFDNQATEYRFTVSRCQYGQLVFVGVQRVPYDNGYQAAERDALGWFDATVAGFAEPALVVRSDGSVASANMAFQEIAGRRAPGTQLYDFPALSGASEANFIDCVWMPSRDGATALPTVRLRGELQAWGARLSPPGAQHLEATLLVFLGPGAPLPAGLAHIGQD
jgi:hypothetical protein